jgi:methylmalonyl-CoA mutase cobalamin-binding subunit
LVHSNLDDGFAAVFCDLACALGAVLLECRVVEELLGARLGHCYGHTYSGRAREVFQRALARVTHTPGTMIYGNTTSYGADEAENYDVLADYLGRDYHGQRAHATGHALNPVPVTEAKRIPDTEEIVDAHVHANRLFERLAHGSPPPPAEDDDRVEAIVGGGRRFADHVLVGLREIGIDTDDAFELLLSLRRIGARRLEELFGPGEPAVSEIRGRRPILAAPGLASVTTAIADEIEQIEPGTADAIRTGGLAVCVASTDVHEYGKLLVEGVLQRLGVRVHDAGVSIDPEALADAAGAARADAIAVSTYNGVALDYLRRLRDECERLDLDVPVYIGGKLNQVPDDGSDSLPVDVAGDLADAGAVVCHGVNDMIQHFARVSRARGGPGS